VGNGILSIEECLSFMHCFALCIAVFLPLSGFVQQGAKLVRSTHWYAPLVPRCAPVSTTLELIRENLHAIL
jgi:hypothetical protein